MSGAFDLGLFFFMIPGSYVLGFYVELYKSWKDPNYIIEPQVKREDYHLYFEYWLEKNELPIIMATMHMLSLAGLSIMLKEMF